MVIKSIGATGGGGGSVTSAEHEALSNVVSNIISAGGGGVSVTSNDLSNRLSVLVDTDLSNAFSDLLSVINVGFSNETSAKDVVSNALSNEISNRASADATLSSRVDTASALGTAADLHASTASAAASVADAHASAASAALSLAISALQTSVQTASAAAQAAEVHASAASAAASVADAHASAVSAALSLAISVIQASIQATSAAVDVVSNALSALSSFVVPTYYFAQVLSVGAGTLVSGTVADLSALGGGDVLVSELGTTPGYTLSANFSSISVLPNTVQLHALYEGGAGHTVNVDVFNHVTSSWDTLGQITEGSVMGFHEYNITGITAHVSATKAKVRINHVSNGNTTHSFTLDYLTMAHLLQTAATLDHGALQGLADDDHLQYALADGSRGFSALSTRVDTASALATTADTHASTASAAATAADLHASTASAAASAADVHASTASAAASAADVHASTTSIAWANASTGPSIAVLSLLSDTKSAVANVSTVSAAGVAIGLQSVINALSARITGGTVSVTSNELSAVANASTVTSSPILANAFSNDASVSAAIVTNLTGQYGTAQFKVMVTGPQAVATATFTQVSGLSLSIGGSGVYIINGQLVWSQSGAGSASAIFGFGMSMTAQPVMAMFRMQGNTGALAAAGGLSAFTQFGGNSAICATPSIMYSAKPNPAVSGSVTNTMFFDGILVASTVQSQLGVVVQCSTAAFGIAVQKGSYIMAYKVG